MNYPYTPESTFSPSPPKRSGSGWLIGIVVGLIAAGGLLCCGGVLLVMYFGLSVMSTEVQDSLAASPEFREHIGSVESFDLNFVRSGNEEDPDVFVYDVVGSAGKGYVTVKQITDSNGDESIEWAELTLSDGRKIPIESKDISTE